jgi:hypothetical protein
MDPKAKRRVPRVVMIGVPLMFIGLVVFLVSMAYRSNKVSRAESPGASVVVSSPAANEFLYCTDCHGDFDKVFTEGLVKDLKFTHAMHFSKVADCSVCHPPETHVPDRINKPTMSRCFTCHGTTKTAIVLSTCTTCHPPDIPQKPTSHLTSTWLPGGHTKEATKDQFLCLTCHQQKFCQSCHVLAMPHPAGWAELPHAQTFFADPGVCTQCHVRTPQTYDYCDRCHHPQGPKDVAWRAYHPTAVTTSGADTCFQCHADQTCRTCHGTGKENFSADQALLLAQPGQTPVPSPAPTSTPSYASTSTPSG